MAIASVRAASPPGARPLRKTALLAAVDCWMVLGSFLIVLGLLAFRPEFATADQLTPARLLVDLGIVASLVLFFRGQGHYTERRPFWQEAGEVVLAFTAALLVDSAAMFFFKLNPSRASVLGYWTLGCVLLLTGRWLVKSWLVAIGQWSLPAVIVGTGQNARDLALALLDDPVPAFKPLAFVDLFDAGTSDPVIAIESDRTLPVVQVRGNPYELLRRFPKAHIVVALELEDFQAGKGFVERLSHAHRDVEVVLPLRGLPTRHSYRTHWVNHDLTTMRLAQPMTSHWQNRVKRVFDMVAATGLLVFFGPLLLVMGGLVMMTGGPAFFGHTRIGRHGRPFRCLKFRTMVVDAEDRLARILEEDPRAAAEWQLNRKLRNDPRVTWIGDFLRRTSLDELPQLLNVLKGEMSLVGPRPVSAEEVEEYGDQRIYYLQAWPGITGLWQVSGRNQLDFKRRVHLDAWYVQNWSLLRDVTILLMTVRVVFSRGGAY